MAVSWLITDGFSGAPSGVDKIVTIGLYSADAPEPATSTYASNWLSPSMRMGVLLLSAWLVFYGRP